LAVGGLVMLAVGWFILIEGRAAKT